MDGMIDVPLHVQRVVTQMATLAERFVLNNEILMIIP